MSIKTITFETTRYRLAPLIPTMEMDSKSSFQQSRTGVYTAMLDAIPDTLPDVIEHTGEPVAFKDVATGAFYLSFDSIPRNLKDNSRIVALFDHALVESRDLSNADIMDVILRTGGCRVNDYADHIEYARALFEEYMAKNEH